MRKAKTSLHLTAAPSYEGDFRGRLLHEFATRDRIELVAQIERTLAVNCCGQL